MPIVDDMVFACSGAAVTRLRMQVERMAPHFRMALLVGERGTGVETVARRMHSLGPQACMPFTAISAVDLLANERFHATGVVFVTALQATESAAQPRLLQRLNALARQARILMASEADPRGMVATGRLRADLYERVGTLEIRVPSLRERLEDLPALLADDLTLDPAAMACLRTHSWPGNLEELFELKTRLMHLGRTIYASDLAFVEPIAQKAVRLDEVIERHVANVLERVGGNKLRAAELLGISRSTLYRMLEGVGA